MFRSECSEIDLIESAKDHIQMAIYDLEWAIEKDSEAKWTDTKIESVKETLYTSYGRLAIDTKERAE